MQEVHISKTVKLIDSPGIVASPSNPPASMALRSLQVEEGQDSVLEAAQTLIKQCDKTQVGQASITKATVWTVGDVSSYRSRLCCSTTFQTIETLWSF